MTDPETATRQRAAPTSSTWDRVTAALHRVGAGLGELVRRGNRRRVTLRDREGTVWLRLPLTLTALLVIVAVVSWAFVPFVVLAIVLFALGFQVSIDRHVDDARNGPDAPTSAA